MKNRHPGSPVLIAMAGLPGTGKSTIAGELARRLDAIVLNKDEIRAKLFPKEQILFSREQDDLCMQVIFVTAEYLLEARADLFVIIDGRTFTRSYQVEQLLSHARALGAKPVIIECVCEDAVAEERLEHDRRAGLHPAGNRDYGLYERLKEEAEPIPADHLTVDTGKEPPEKIADRCIRYLEELL